MACKRNADSFGIRKRKLDRKVQVNHLPSIDRYLDQLNSAESTNEVARVPNLRSNATTLVHKYQTGSKRKLVPILPKNSIQPLLAETEISLAKKEGQLAVHPKKCVWSKEEDARLTDMVKKHHGRNWPTIANHMENRNAKQCRDRWHTQLKDDIIKSKWTDVEDELLLKHQNSMGNTWAAISKLLPGRTPTAIKNRFRSLRLQQRKCTLKK